MRTVICAVALLWTTAAMAITPARYIKLTVVKGKPVTLSNGVTLSLVDVSYAHTTQGNYSLCRLTVTYAGKSHRVTLDRVKEPAPTKPSGVRGMALRLEGVDAYIRPTRAWIGVFSSGQLSVVATPKKR